MVEGQTNMLFSFLVFESDSSFGIKFYNKDFYRLTLKNKNKTSFLRKISMLISYFGMSKSSITNAQFDFARPSLCPYPLRFDRIQDFPLWGNLPLLLLDLSSWVGLIFKMTSFVSAKMYSKFHNNKESVRISETTSLSL